MVTLNWDSLKHPLSFVFLRASVISMVSDINCYVFDIIGYDIRGADFLTSGILSKQLC